MSGLPRTPGATAPSQSSVPQSPRSPGHQTSPRSPMHQRNVSSSTNQPAGCPSQPLSPTGPPRQSPNNNKRQSITSATMPNIDSLTIVKQSPSLAVKPPKLGSLGLPLNVKANFFKIENKYQNFISYKYECNQALNRLSKNRVMRRCASLLLRQYRLFEHAATNYTNLFYTSAKHPLIANDGQQAFYDVDYYEPEESRPRQGPDRLLIRITITKEAEFPLHELTDHLNNVSSSSRIADFIAMFNAFLDRPISENPNMATLARRTKFFNLAAGGRHSLGSGLEAHKGFFKSVRDCAGGLYLNLNSSAGAFFKEGRLDQLIESMGKSKSVGHQLKGARVCHSYMGKLRVKTISGLAPSFDSSKPPFADNVRFDCPTHGPKETVADHFAKTYPNAKRPNPQALVMDLGNSVCVPSDLLTMMPAQPFRGLLSPDQTSNMITFACRLPRANKNLINGEGIPAFKLSDQNGPTMLFGISLAGESRPEMVRIQARRLPAPRVIYAGDKEAPKTDVAEGGWNLKSKTFKQSPSRIHTVTYIELHYNKEHSCTNLKDFTDEIQNALKRYFGSNRPNFITGDHKAQHNITIPKIEGKFNARALQSRLVECFSTMLTNANLSLVFVILPDKGPELYNLVKKVADTLVGLHAICTVKNDKNFVKAKPQEIANLMLKCNQKLGGVNHTFVLSDEHAKISKIWGTQKRPAMFIGADVTHPGPSSMHGAPSIAAVVASYENTFTQYPGSVRLQKHKDDDKKALEMIERLDEMVHERLELYKSKNNVLPDRIVYIRDGVSDGQFTQVLAEEIEGRHGLKAVVKSFYQQNKAELPHLLVVVAQKRHHTRFYQDFDDQGICFDKRGNPLPGFTVDNTIVSPKNFDWYTTSHGTIQGTSRPAKYVVLYDTMGSSADEVQLLMFHMCYTMGRSTRSIGIHPAARYADLLCDRARAFLREVYAPPLGGVRSSYDPRGNHWPGRIAANVKDSMFYI